MNAPPPPYSLTDQQPNHHHQYNNSATQPHSRRHSYHPSSHQPHHHQSQSQHSSLNSNSSSSFSSRFGRSSNPISRSSTIHQFNHNSNANTNTYTHTNQSEGSNQDRSRGLGSLLIGLGAASILSNTLNNHSSTSTSSATGLSSHQFGVGIGEDPLSILTRYDTILLIDDSASMSLQNRWKEASLAVSGLAETLVRYDSDGIDVYFMNSTEHLRNTISAAEVNRLFERVRPVGRSTPTDVRVEELLGVYLDKLEYAKMNNLPTLKPLNLIVITDGEADDPDTLTYALAGFIERLDQARFPLTQLGVQFIQIGNDPIATRFLNLLDDELKTNPNSKRDIVDTTPYQGKLTTQFLIKALLGGINKRIDHQRCFA